MKNYIFFLFIFLFLMNGIRAQTPTDAIMMKQRESCFALIYDHGAFDKYWEGAYLRSNGTIATVHRNTVLPMIAIGFFDRLNLIVAAPHIQTESSEPNGGKFAGAKGFQDLSLALKYLAAGKRLGEGELAFLSTLGFSTPLTNYLSDYRPYSIGFGANELSLRGILQYKWDNGLYARTALAYLWRGQTKAERDYYYNNGSYYTAWMDVPSAWQFQGVFGKWMLDNSLRIEASYTGLRSVSGDDIRPYNAAQPTNKVHEGLLGASAQYYFSKPKGLGLLAYFSHMVNGRNTGKPSIFGGGITYQFNL